MLDLGVGGPAVLDGQFRELVRLRPRTPAGVDDEPRRDRQHPGAQVFAVVEPVVGAECAQERLLERILGRLPAQPTAEEAEHDVAVLDVEALERGDGHGCLHHPYERGRGRICESAAMNMAVVGHVEWIEFLRVEAVPKPGEIVGSTEVWAEPAGGGGVASVELARLAGRSALYCLLGGDDLGAQSRVKLEAAGVRVHSPSSDEPQRRGFCYVDDVGERTITVIGDKPRPPGGEGSLPWEELDSVDGVYFTAGDAEAVRQARRARVLVATARELPTLHAAGVELDALVASGEDDAERYQAGDLDPPPRLVVSTAGALGGWAQPGGPYKPAAPPGPFEDAYGAGDCFAAGLTFALAQGMEIPDALAFASERGALALTRRGAGLTG